MTPSYINENLRKVRGGCPYLNRHQWVESFSYWDPQRISILRIQLSLWEVAYCAWKRSWKSIFETMLLRWRNSVTLEADILGEDTSQVVPAAVKLEEFSLSDYELWSAKFAFSLDFSSTWMAYENTMSSIFRAEFWTFSSAHLDTCLLYTSPSPRD